MEGVSVYDRSSECNFKKDSWERDFLSLKQPWDFLKDDF